MKCYTYAHCKHPYSRFKDKNATHEESSQNSHNSWPFPCIWKMMFSPFSPHQFPPPQQPKHTDAHTNAQTQPSVRARRQRAIWLHKVSRILKGEAEKSSSDGWLWQGRQEREREREKETERERSRRQMVALNSVLPKTTHKDLRVMDWLTVWEEDRRRRSEEVRRRWRVEKGDMRRKIRSLLDL